MKIIEIKLKDTRVIRVCISDNQKIYKLLAGLEVEKWEIIQNGISTLTNFNKFKKRDI